MARRLPSLNALKAFESAARHASFSLAGAELNVTHAAVSRHIRELEASLGAKLFIRTGRGVQLTETGQSLARDIAPAFDILIHATERFTGPRRRRDLVISAELSFAALWLAPRLGGFTSKHPEIDLVLDPANRVVDFATENVDLGVRYGRGKWPGVEAVKLMDSDLTPVCSPAFLRTMTIRSPRDLAAATLLREDLKENWGDWLAAAGVKHTRPSGPILKGHLAVAAAEAGQGFALADAIQAGDALLAKRLVRPFGVVVRHYAYWAVRGAAKPETNAAALFRSWLQAEIAQTLSALKNGGV